jgi:hypothetical protein
LCGNHLGDWLMTLSIADPLALLDRVRRLFGERRALVRRRRALLASPAAADLPLSLSGARFSLVGLSELRIQLGDRWPELSNRVHDLAEAVIRRHLTRGDVFDAHGDDGYVILFTQLSQVQAEFKCRVIAKEIAAKLLGADWPGRSAEALVFELEETALGAPSFERALGEAIARGRPVMAEVTVPGSGARVACNAAGPGSVPMEAVAERQASPAFKPIVRDRADVAYTPIWEFGAAALLRFRLAQQPFDVAAGGGSDAAKADIAALAQALFDVSRLAAVGRRLSVICPVHFSTVLREGSRVQISRMLRAATPSTRKLVTLEVVIEEHDSDWISSLERAWTSMPGTPVASVPLQASAVPVRRSQLVRHLNLALADDFSANKAGIGVLGAFVQKAERVGLTCGVAGLRTRAAVLAASAAGFAQLAGSAVHRDIGALGKVTHFDLKSLYRDLLPQAS